MTKNITEQYLENYLDEKYEALCKELLAKRLETTQGLNYRVNGLRFSSIFEELIFVCLYDELSFNSLRDHIIGLVFSMLEEIPEYEVDLLVLRPLESLGVDGKANRSDILERKELYISRQILVLVNDELLGYFSAISEKKYEELTMKLIQGVKEFSISGSLLSEGYDFNTYWDEFCFISQEDCDLFNDFYVETIFNYVTEEIEKLPLSELKVLYSSSPEIWVDEYHNPFSDKNEMINYISNKLFDMLSWTAANEYIDNDEDEDDDN